MKMNSVCWSPVFAENTASVGAHITNGLRAYSCRNLLHHAWIPFREIFDP